MSRVYYMEAMEHLYFFGRFNFPHYGYLYVIRESLKQLRPDQGMTLIFSSDKTTWGKHAIPLRHRLAMFELAILELPENLRAQIHFSSIEYDLQRKLGSKYGGYTIDTLRELGTTLHGSSAIIMGADALLGVPSVHDGFMAWKDWKEIQSLASIVTLPRGRYSSADEIKRNLPIGLSVQILDALPNTIELHASSTAIAQGNHAFLPESVREYARIHELLLQY